MWSKRESGVAVTCLIVGSLGQLVQYVVSPVSEGASAAKNVAKAVAHPTAAAAWSAAAGLRSRPARHTARPANDLAQPGGELIEWLCDCDVR